MPHAGGPAGKAAAAAALDRRRHSASHALVWSLISYPAAYSFFIELQSAGGGEKGDGSRAGCCAGALGGLPAAPLTVGRHRREHRGDCRAPAGALLASQDRVEGIVGDCGHGVVVLQRLVWGRLRGGCGAVEAWGWVRAAGGCWAGRRPCRLLFRSPVAYSIRRLTHREQHELWDVRWREAVRRLGARAHARRGAGGGAAAAVPAGGGGSWDGEREGECDVSGP